MISVTCKH